MEPSWDDQGSSIWACLPLFWFRSRTYVCTLVDVCLINVLCEVAIVSQLFIPFLFITWDCVKMTRLATIFYHNAVMPLSRASTRGRYSRIVGVTSW